MHDVNTLVVESGLESRLESLLTTQTFGQSLRWYESVTSTNTLAAEWALMDGPDGAVVSAEFQTAGRGRFNRVWSAFSGQNLTFSIILFPGLPSDRLGMISVAFSVAVADLLRAEVGRGRVDIKWPNDILLDGAKVCGMLQESAFPSVGSSKRVILGLGLNVNQVVFPDDVGTEATSMRLATDREFDRVEIMADLLSRMETAYQSLHTGKAAVVRSRYEALMLTLGRTVTFVRMPRKEPATGIVTGIDERGGLVILTESGPEIVFAGDVSMKTE